MTPKRLSPQRNQSFGHPHPRIRCGGYAGNEPPTIIARTPGLGTLSLPPLRKYMFLVFFVFHLRKALIKSTTFGNTSDEIHGTHPIFMFLLLRSVPSNRSMISSGHAVT